MITPKSWEDLSEWGVPDSEIEYLRMRYSSMFEDFMQDLRKRKGVRIVCFDDDGYPVVAELTINALKYLKRFI